MQPPENQKMERLNRLLQETMRCLLYSSQLPLTFWNSAVIYGAFLWNQLPQEHWTTAKVELGTCVLSPSAVQAI